MSHIGKTIMIWKKAIRAKNRILLKNIISCLLMEVKVI